MFVNVQLLDSLDYAAELLKKLGILDKVVKHVQDVVAGVLDRDVAKAVLTLYTQFACSYCPYSIAGVGCVVAIAVSTVLSHVEHAMAQRVVEVAESLRGIVEELLHEEKPLQSTHAVTPVMPWQLQFTHVQTAQGALQLLHSTVIHVRQVADMRTTLYNIAYTRTALETRPSVAKVEIKIGEDRKYRFHVEATKVTVVPELVTARLRDLDRDVDILFTRIVPSPATPPVTYCTVQHAITRVILGYDKVIHALGQTQQ